MAKRRAPHLIPLPHGVLGWLSLDPDTELIPKTIDTKHGTLVWLPNSMEAKLAEVIDIGTLIGRIFWINKETDINGLLVEVEEEVKQIEEKFPNIEIQFFLKSYLPIILIKCLQDAASQAIREAYAIVKAKGKIDYPSQRSKYLESIADIARQASLERFRLTGLYDRLKPGEHINPQQTLEEGLATIIEEFFGDEQRIKKAISEILQEDGEPTPRAIARKLKIGKACSKRDRDSGVKLVERMLKKLRPDQKPGQTIAAFVVDLTAAKMKNTKKKITRRKIK